MNDTNYDFLGIEGLKANTQVKVTNMARANVSYNIEELHIRREFRPYIDGQQPHSQLIPFDELFKLNNMQGGPQIIYDNLLIEDNDIRKALGLPTTEENPEYTYTRDEVFAILEKGDKDEILDMLEFGPYYIAEWVKEDIVNIDSSRTRRLIGGLFSTNVELMEDLLQWSAEGDAEGTQLGYGTIKGVKTTNVAGNTRTRRKGTISNDREPQAQEEAPAQNQRRKQL